MTDVTTDTIDNARTEIPTVEHESLRRVMEFYFDQDWTDGMPVMPVTESYLAEFLARTSRDPDEVLFSMTHLNRSLTVRHAAINAALAGCLPEYLPVVIAAWEGIAQEPTPKRGIWQSTTGTAPFTVVNGPVRNTLKINSAGNLFGSGFRANATIGRAIRLALINVFGLRPHQLDQATQATPAKYSACIGENEEKSPWPPMHTEFGFDASDSVVTSFVIRSVIHLEARHTSVPEQLALDLIDTIRRTGVMIHENNSVLLVLSPEHAHVFADAGWSKDDLRHYIAEKAVRTRAELAAVGKDAMSRHTHWRVPGDHPDAVPDEASSSADPDVIPVTTGPHGIQILVAGADNAGVSAIVEILRLTVSRDGWSYSKVEDL
ncbi:MAG: hypothetical protein ACTH31_04880 [Pseudoclavibacter sp.]